MLWPLQSTGCNKLNISIQSIEHLSGTLHVPFPLICHIDSQYWSQMTHSDGPVSELPGCVDSFWLLKVVTASWTFASGEISLRPCCSHLFVLHIIPATDERSIFPFFLPLSTPLPYLVCGTDSCYRQIQTLCLNKCSFVPCRGGVRKRLAADSVCPMDRCSRVN